MLDQKWLRLKRNNSSMFRRPVEEQEMYDIVGFKNKTKWTVRSVIDGIVEPLMYIFNILSKGHQMKVAKVVPIYKTRARHFANCRPVSALSQFSKILEKLFMKWFDSFVEKHESLTDSMDLEIIDGQPWHWLTW